MAKTPSAVADISVTKLSTPRIFLVRMLVFLILCGLIGFVLYKQIWQAFLANPGLNALIGAVLAIGIILAFRQVIRLYPEISWINSFRISDPGLAIERRPTLLAPMAAMLSNRSGRMTITQQTMRHLLDSIATRLDEARDLSRYMTGLLVFLGLLGTFWGLLETIGAVADAIVGMQVTGGDAVQIFAKLKQGIEGPLKGMSTAFGASLFGLSGSLVLGFLELQASQAQGRFHTELEEWLAGATRLSSGTLQTEGEQGVSAYVEALLERTADGLDDLARTLRRSEEGREQAAAANAALVERLSSLTESMRSQQALLARLAEQSIELRGVVGRLTERKPDTGNEALLAHQRNLEAALARLIDESVRGRTALADELRGEFRLLARTIASTRSATPGDD